MQLSGSKCLVVKVGSALLVDEEKQSFNIDWLTSLIADLVHYSKQGTSVVLVSSGAMAYGKLSLNLTNKPISLDRKQAIAAVGQVQLMHQYQLLLSPHGLTAGQVLLSMVDTENRRRYINVRNTLKELLAMGIIPIINENDSVATEEIRYGDNDRLAARVAQLVDAEHLVLLSDIDGFYTDDPRRDPNAKLMPQVDALTPDILNMAKESSTNYGSGGMITKLAAAEIAIKSGCHMLITAGKHAHPLQTYDKHRIGTWFKADKTPTNAKKIWLQQHLQPVGGLVIDAGASEALQRGASLLPVGIVDVQGPFHKGDVITLLDSAQKPLGRGIVNYSSQEVLSIKGKNASDINNTLGYDGCHEVVHRDNLIIL